MSEDFETLLYRAKRKRESGRDKLQFFREYLESEYVCLEQELEFENFIDTFMNLYDTEIQHLENCIKKFRGLPCDHP